MTQIRGSATPNRGLALLAAAVSSLAVGLSAINGPTAASAQAIPTTIVTAGPLSAGSGEGSKADLVVQAGHSETVTFVGFVRGGRLFVTASEDGSAKLWDVATGALVKTLSGHLAGGINFSVVSTDGSMLATAGENQNREYDRAWLWDTATGKLLRTIGDEARSIESVNLSPDGRTLATADEFGQVLLWDASSGALLHKFRDKGGLPIPYVGAVSFSTNGRLMAWAGSVWELHTDTLVFQVDNYGPECCISPDGRILATVGRDNSICLWSIENGTLLHALRGHTNSVLTMRFSPDGRILATGSRDKTARVWDVATGSLMNTLVGHTEQVACLSFSPDGEA